MLSYLNNKFVNSSNKTKIELYILPLLFVYLLFYFFKNINHTEIVKSVKNNLNINEFKNKNFDGSFLQLFTDIEKIAKNSNFYITSLNNDNKIIKLKIDGKKEKLPIFINQIENLNNFTKIDTLNVYKKDSSDLYSFDFIIDLNKFFIKRIDITNNESKNEIILKTEKVVNLNIKSKIDYKLKAIIANYVLVNDKWLEIGDSIDDLKLIKIDRNSVFFKDKDKKLELVLANEEYLKNIY